MHMKGKMSRAYQFRCECHVIDGRRLLFRENLNSESFDVCKARGINLAVQFPIDLRQERVREGVRMTEGSS